MNTFRSYDASGNRTTAQEDTTVVQSTFNEINQIETLPSSGAIRFEGTLDKPGTVTLNGAPARMLTGTHFETDLVLPSGTTSHVYVAATDGNNNQSTQEYLVNVPATGGMEPEYDADGNTITNGRGHTYAWDAESRLISITYGDDSKTEFTYDALSRRVAVVEKDPMGTETSAKHLFWIGLSICEERDALHAVTKRYHANGFTDGVGAKFFYTRDHLGSVREVVDATGAITDRYRYDPYGKVERVTPPPSPSVSSDFRYTGHYYHEKSDLHLAAYRAYDATIGRWLSEDPIEENGGINLYGYVNNNPLQSIDLLGLADAPSNYVPLMVTDPNFVIKTPMKELDDGAGNNKGECVSLVKRLTGTTNAGASSELWRSGSKLSPTNLPLRGTAIATFNSAGRFPAVKGWHSAIFLAPAIGTHPVTGEKCSGITVFDQFPGKPAFLRFIPWDGEGR